MIKKIKASQGFTFIEVMLAVVIITITSMGLMYGVVHARSELRALENKERATEELSNYMEHWKGRIASGNLSTTDKLGDYTGKEIYLIGDAQTDEKVTVKDEKSIIKGETTSRSDLKQSETIEKSNKTIVIIRSRI